ncbi:helix-turn-helix domain-containing protein [Kibdelosporangium lantanae]
METTFPPPENCNSRTVIDVLANKWVIYVLAALRERDPMRFNELSRRLGNITQKVLTQTLRTLERDGLVTRTVYPTTPPRVDYALTDLGRDLSHVVLVIGEWSHDHADEILTARHHYDNKPAPTPVT